MIVFSKFKHVFNKYPISRGIATYIITWPIASIIQQSIAGKRFETYDWKEAGKFAMYGGLYVAPTLYLWVRLTGILWPAMTLKTAIFKVSLEQVTYAPFGISSFLFIINALDGKPTSECFNAVREKFFPTFRTGVCFWPMVQVISYSVIPERDRVVVSSVCSLIWTVYLAYIKNTNDEDKRAKKL